MPGIFMPRDFIIAMASGGICGLSAISMVEEMFHRPAFPCAAKAAAGARTMTAAINPGTNLRCIPVPREYFRGESDRNAAPVNCLTSIVQLRNERPHAAAIVALPVGAEAAAHPAGITAETSLEIITAVEMLAAAPQDLRPADAFHRTMADAFQNHSRAALAYHARDAVGV